MDKYEEAGINFIRHNSPEGHWMKTLTEAMPDEVQPVEAPRRTRRLRRMQRQNFVQRAVFNVVQIFKREKEVA